MKLEHLRLCKCLLLVVLLTALASAAFADDKAIITVLDFKTDSFSKQEMISIISLLSSALFKTGKYTVIDVTERDNLLKELEFSMSDCSDESCQLEIGKMLAAEMIVVGSLSQVGSKTILTAKILATGTGRTLSTADGIYPDVDNLVDDIFPFARELAGLEREEKIDEKDETEDSSKEIKPIYKRPFFIVGIIGTGVGGYLLYDSISFFQGTVTDARTEYEDAGSGADFDILYGTYEEKQQEFIQKLIISGTVTSVGIALTAISISLHTRAKAKLQNPAKLGFSGYLNSYGRPIVSIMYKY